MLQEIILPDDKNISINFFSRILKESLTNSYKIFWFKAIYENIINGKKEMSFYECAVKMVSYASIPLIKYKLSLGIQDSTYQIIEKISDKYPEIFYENNLNEVEKNILKINNLKCIKNILTLVKYVPYRLLTPFYSEDIRKLKLLDNKKNKYIEERTLEDNKCLYKILGQKIVINDKYFNYIYKNQAIIKDWIDYNLIIYLQKRNPNIPNIPFKIYLPLTRDLNEITKLWKEVLSKNKIIDIYTGLEFNEENYKKYGGLSIDHYIPWSFVLHDEKWNLIPTFKNINSSKNNNLPSLEKTLDRFCELQYILFCYIKNNKSKKCLEDYLNMNNAMQKICIKSEIYKEEFKEALKNAIIPLYQIAYNQGYMLWK